MTRNLFSDALNFPRRFIGGRLAKGERTPVSELSPGDGSVLQVDGEKLAVHRDREGELHAVSPVCTHLGCMVEWNGTEDTWDCPCHGSRYRPDGTVIHGPAKKPLAAKDISERPTP